MTSLLNLEGKITFITGSTRGIGWAAARKFASQGATVILNGRSNQALLDSRVAALKSSFGIDSIGLLADASDPLQVKDCYQALFKRYRRLDVLINNAGILEEGLLGMVTHEATARLFATNTLGAIDHLQAASRLMGRTRSGTIINVSSIIGIKGNAGQAVYSATKAALLGLTLSAAKELGPAGIRVNAVAPGFIETEMMETTPDVVKSRQIGQISLGRAGSPDDVANTLLFLASDLATYVTGQVLGVDGGMIV